MRLSTSILIALVEGEHTRIVLFTVSAFYFLLSVQGMMQSLSLVRAPSFLGFANEIKTLLVENLHDLERNISMRFTQIKIYKSEAFNLYSSSFQEQPRKRSDSPDSSLKAG